MPTKQYNVSLWELDTFLDTARYKNLSSCVSFVEGQVEDFDERNETDLGDEYGELIQAAFLILLVSSLEHQLRKICEVVGKKRNLKISPHDMRGSVGFDACVAYLDKVLHVESPKAQLKFIRGVVGLRNSLVHEGGYLSDESRRLVELSKSLGLSKDGRLLIKGDFVQEVSNRIGAFVDSLVQRLSSSQGPRLIQALRKEERS